MDVFTWGSCNRLSNIECLYQTGWKCRIWSIWCCKWWMERIPVLNAGTGTINDPVSEMWFRKIFSTRIGSCSIYSVPYIISGRLPCHWKRSTEKNASQRSAESGMCMQRSMGSEPYRPVAGLLLLKWVAGRAPVVRTGLFVKAGIREALLLL